MLVVCALYFDGPIIKGKIVAQNKEFLFVKTGAGDIYMVSPMLCGILK